MAMMLQEQGGTEFSVLDEGECLRLLEQKAFGRVAVCMGAMPGIFPVNYAMGNGDIYFLTSDGTKFAGAVRGVCVAFEIDGVDSAYHQGWSVMAVGIAEHVGSDDATRLLEHLPLEPWAPGVRDRLVRVRPEFLSGRRISFVA